MENLQYDHYENCDPNDPCNNYGYGYNYRCGYQYGGGISAPTTIDSDQSSSKQESDVQEEDSFGTNNQVFGVDEADIVKSDGDWVFAGYGDVLYVWHATKGAMSPTEEECPSPVFPTTIPIFALTTETTASVQEEDIPSRFQTVWMCQ